MPEKKGAEGGQKGLKFLGLKVPKGEKKDSPHKKKVQPNSA